jgi:peptidoglycan hydrolase-like protein with peptidoglycan-binding domain
MALTWPLLKKNSRNEPVQSVQYLLRAHGRTVTVDGIFGPNTEAAVRAFQSSTGLAADGIVGDRTWTALVITVRKGNTGDAVRAVQDQANSRTGDPGHPFPVDGVFGPRTDEWVRGFQRGVGIGVDGIVGPVTWNHLVKGELNI